MHIPSKSPYPLYAGSRRIVANLFVFSLVISCANWAQADFTANGDIDGTVDNAGNTTSPGDLIIGGTGTGSLLGDGDSPLVEGDLNPLRSDLAIIGNEERSVGAVTLEDFLFLRNETDPRGGNWLIDEDLAVGNNGQGFLNLLNSARVEVTDDTWVGGSDGSGALVNATGEGYGLITINGAGTRLVTGDRLTRGFYVGFNGVGDVEVSGRGSIESLGFAVIGEENGANGQVTLTDRGTRWTIDGDLTIGNGRAGLTTAYGTLRINNEARVLVKDNIVVNSRGIVQLNGGTLELLDPSDTITNNGKISGGGFIAGDVLNNGTILARDAELHFNGIGGLTNTGGGSLVLGGDTTIYGNVTGGGIHVLADSAATLVGDLLLSGSSILALTVGEDAGRLDVIGGIDLGSSTLDLEYSSGIFAQMGDTYEILDSTQSISGTFANAGDQVSDDNGQIWDIIYNTSSVWVTATSLTAPAIAGDFDADGDVDGADFLRWQRGGSPTPGSSGDLDDWERNYGMSNSVAAITAVPEPSTLALALLTLTCCPRRRRGEKKVGSEKSPG